MASKVKTFFSKHSKAFFEYAMLFLCLLILERANVAKIIYPFGFSLAFALCYLGKNGFVIGLEYALCHLIYNPNFEGIIVSLSTASAIILLYLIFKLLKRKISFTFTLLFALLSQVGYVYFHLSSPEQVVITFVMILVALCFVYICTQTFGAIFYRGLQSRFTMDETVCFGIFLIAFFSGFNDLYIYDANLTSGIFLLLILVASKTLVRTSTIFFSALMGLGIAFSSLGITYLAIYVTYGIICASLSKSNKFLSPVMIFIIDVVFGYFLNAYAVYSYVNFLPLLIASIIYLCIPNKVFTKIRGLSYSYEGSLANDYMVSLQAGETKQKLAKLSVLFKDMERTYLNLSMGEIDRKQAVDILTHQVIHNHCKHCVNFNKCLENNNIKNAIDNLFDFGMEKGKISLLDANNLLTSTCLQLTALIVESNQNLQNYFEYEKTVKSQDDSKLAVSEHLAGTSDIFGELAKNSIGGQNVDQKVSRILLDELTYNKVIANECVVLTSDMGIEKIILVIRNRDVLSPNISLSLRSIFKMNFTNISRTMSRLAGWSILVFIPANKYNLAVGFAGSGKTPEASGDTHGFIKISESKYLFSIADGMGHGKDANKISSLALSLIENFYKAGFSSHIIMDSVNRIMLSSSEENFTTLDACLIDLSNGTVDFIKIGASASVIKSKESSGLVVGESLPLGIISEVHPSIIKRVLKVQDIVILASDGIVDSFSSQEEYLAFVNNERTVNVQMLADSILEEAQSRALDHKDDMTVITIKLNSNF